SGLIPYVSLERIDYEDSAPWPAGADGSGAALRRKVLAAYGNDPNNWIVGLPDFGLGPNTGTAPQIVVQPANQFGLLYQTTILSVVATGSDPMRYQWFFNGASIVGGTSATLTIPDMREEKTGIYSVTVYNRAGAVVSSNATVRLGLPAYFVTVPRDVRLRGSTNDADYGYTTNNAV